MKWLSKSLALLLLMSSSLTHAVQEGQMVPQECPAKLADTVKNIDFSAYKGKVVLIDFWASWCGPCQKSMPFLNQLRNERQNDGFEVIAINVDEDTKEALQLLQEHPVDYVMAFDPKAECPKIFNVKAMPSSYFVDKAGKVRKIHLGYRDGDQTVIRELVSALLAE
jgi:thiol-disulfide isomerase/thioredoxin